MEWLESTLGAICDMGAGVIRTGPFGAQLHQHDYSEEGVPVVMPKDIVSGRISTSSIARISDEHVARLSQHKLHAGDIVYGRRGDIGRCALIREAEAGWLCGTGCLRIALGKGEVLPEYLFYYLSDPSVIAWIFSQAVGATMPNLNTGILRSIPVRYPQCEAYQRHIIAILSAYDDLIENNTRRIEVLEEIARRLYDEWFVQFRFPGYEGVTFKESELGLIPEGWQVLRLGDCVELAYGKALKAQDRVPGDYPVYGSSGVVGTHCECLVEGPGIVVGRKGNVGSVFWSDVSFFPIDTTYYVRSDVPFSYVYFNLQRQRFLNNDAAVPGLNREQAYALPFLLPEQDVLLRFSSEWESIYGLLRRLERINVNLRAQRDLLLPKLISGEIDVSDIPMPT